MITTAYVAPTELEAVHAQLREHGPGARLLAGGTDLLVQMRAGSTAPDVIVDLKRVGLRTITESEVDVRIGALTTYADLARSDLVERHAPALREAARWVGGPPLRSRATLGGNLVTGSPAADGAPPLLVADATAVIASPCGLRSVPVSSFHLAYRETVLAGDEVLVELVVPKATGASASAFVKVGLRRAMIIASVSVACSLRSDSQGRITAARLAFGSVAATAMRAIDAEASLVGSGLDELDARTAAAIAAGGVQPISDGRASAEYRRRLVEIHTRRIIELVGTRLRNAVDLD